MLSTQTISSATLGFPPKGLSSDTKNPKVPQSLYHLPLLLHLSRWDLYELDVLTDSPNPFDAHQFGHPLETRERHLIHNCDEFLGLTDDQVETFRVSHGRYIGIVHKTRAKAWATP